MKRFKSTFAYFVNPFICDIIEGGFPASEIILVEKAVAELELLEMKEDQAMQMQHKSTTIIEFGKLVQESKYPHLKKAACRLILIFGIQNIAGSLCTPQ